MLVPRPHFFAHLVWAPGRLRRLFPSNLDDHQLSSPLSSLIFSFCRLCSWCCVLCLLRGHVACDIECPLSTFHSVCWIRTLASGMTVNRHRRSHTPHARLTFSLHNTTLYLSFSLFLCLALNLFCLTPIVLDLDVL